MVYKCIDLHKFEGTGDKKNGVITSRRLQNLFI